MADNVIYVLDVLEPDRRAAIIAHNGHVARMDRQLLPNGRRLETNTLGVLLGDRFGGEYRVLGTLVGDGWFCAVPALLPRSKTTHRYRLVHPVGALERKLAAVEPRPWILDIGALPEGSLPDVAFIGGHGYSWGWPWSWLRALEYRETNLAEAFDHLVYFPTARPDVLPGCGGMVTATAAPH